MRSSRIYLSLFLLLFCSIAFWSLSNQRSLPPSTPAPQTKAQTVLTPAHAAQIAQNRFPDSEVEAILLDDNGDSYDYLVTIHTPEQDIYQLRIALADGHIHDVTALETAQPPLLPLTTIAEQLKDDYPAAHIQAITLQNEKQLLYYQAILKQDQTQLILLLQAADGQILQEQRTPAANQPESVADFAKMLTLAADALPQKQLTALSLTASGQYNALYQDDGYQYALLFDAKGNEAARTTTQRTSANGTLTAQGSIALAE